MRLSILLLSISISGFATQVTWNDSVNGSSWNFAGHWSPSGIPGTSDTAIFNTIGNNMSDQFMISIIAPTSLGAIEFNNENPTTSYWIFSPLSLQLNPNTGKALISVTATNQTQTLIDTPLILGKDSEINNLSAHKIRFNQTISGDRNVNLSGLIEYSGTTPNTYTGTTSLRNGTLFLNKESGVNAICGNLILNTSSVEYLNNLQIGSSSIVTLQDRSRFNIGSAQETIRKLILEKSSSPNIVHLDAAGGLSITESLELADSSSIEGRGTLFLRGENSKIIFTGSKQNGEIHTNLNLGNQSRSISVTSLPRLSLHGEISEGGIVKTGSGILDITSSANLSGLSIQEGGVHLNGHLVSATPIQISPQGYLYGTGTIQGDLVIQGTVSVGDVVTNNTPSIITEYFSFEKVDSNLSSKDQILFLTGDYSSAQVSDGIHVDGNLVFSPQSTLVVKFSPHSLTQIDTHGKIVLDSPNILISPVEGFYQLNQTHNILYAGAIEGQVGNISSRFPLLNPIVSYLTEDGYSGLSFALSLNRFSDVVTTGNGSQVTSYLDALTDSPRDNSSIILEALINTATVDELSASLSQLQPSALTALSVSQENNLFYLRNAIYHRLYQEQQSCLCSTENPHGVQVWGGLFGGSAHQVNEGREPGYLAQSPGAILAMDANVNDNTLFGGGVGYTYTFHKWKRHRGDANIQSIYATIYSQFAKSTSFFSANVTGGYSFYDVNRKIHLGPSKALHASANSNFQGWEGSIDLKMGAHFPFRSTIVTPFLGFDYMLVAQNEIQEKGARVLNLKIKSHMGDLLTSEGGFECNFCHWKGETFLKALLRFSAIAESRFFGRYEKASFADSEPFKVKGWYPSRILGSFGTALSATVGKSTVSFAYQAKTNWQFTDQLLSLEYLFKF